MAQDFARKRRPGTVNKRGAAGKKQTRQAGRNAFSRGRWYGGGVLTGFLLSFLLYLGTLPPQGGSAPATGPDGQGADSAPATQPPKPRFDFYKLLPEQTIDVELEPAELARPRDAATTELYLLQAGSFRQRQDADRRRAELLLLGLDPKVEETSGDNGRWFRVYVGPFDSRSKMAKARSLTASQDIDTLLLKRGRP